MPNFQSDPDCPGPVVSVNSAGTFDGQLCCYAVTYDRIVPDCGTANPTTSSGIAPPSGVGGSQHQRGDRDGQHRACVLPHVQQRDDERRGALRRAGRGQRLRCAAELRLQRHPGQLRRLVPRLLPERPPRRDVQPVPRERLQHRAHGLPRQLSDAPNRAAPPTETVRPSLAW